MLSREDCEQIEQVLHKELSTRQALGGYSPDAPTIQYLCKICFELIRHIRETLPPTTVGKTKGKRK